MLCRSFRFKKKFCNIRCISKEGIASKIPFSEFLQILPRDEINRFYLEQNIFNMKRDLIEQPKNGVLVELGSRYYHQIFVFYINTCFLFLYS